jgi:hypothetical protein
MTKMIEASIKGMLIVEFVYKGDWRSVEPHLLGISKKGKLCLSAFQIAGGSGQSWRAYLVEEIQNFVVTNDTFDGPRPGYNPNDSTMSSIICRL